MKGSQEEVSSFTIKPQSESSDEVSKSSAQKDGKEGNIKDGKEDKFGGVFDAISDQIKENNSNPENDKIVKISVGIKSSALNKASKNTTDAPAKVPAEKITVYESGREEKETIEIDISPEQAQGLMDEAEQDKGSVKDQIHNMATDAMKSMMKSVMDNLSGKITGSEDNEISGPGTEVSSEKAPEIQGQER